MARDFGPFPSKPMYEVVNRRMQRALAEATASTGFAKSGQGAVTAGTGAQLIIAAYPDGALVDGLYVENPASETATLTTNSGSTNLRIDRLVLRLDMSAQTIAPFQIVGTPAASPSAPPLVQTATVYDMPLVRYTMPGSASAQNPGSIVDERTLATGLARAYTADPYNGSAVNVTTALQTITYPDPGFPHRVLVDSNIAALVSSGSLWSYEARIDTTGGALIRPLIETTATTYSRLPIIGGVSDVLTGGHSVLFCARRISGAAGSGFQVWNPTSDASAGTTGLNIQTFRVQVIPA